MTLHPILTWQTAFTAAPLTKLLQSPSAAHPPVCGSEVPDHPATDSHLIYHNSDVTLHACMFHRGALLTHAHLTLS